LARKHLEAMKTSLVKCAFFFEIFAYLFEISSIALQIPSQREFWLLFLMVISEFQNSLIMSGRFSRDPLKKPRILNEHFLILTIIDCSSYDIVSTLKFSSSSGFWLMRYKGTKSLSPPSYLKKGRPGHENSFLFPRRQ
jgi:hypothetical protein